jgi:cobalt-zinc-cadmium resistance protein CzcA
MNRWFAALLARRWPVLVVGALVAALGGAVWLRLPVDAFPDVTNVQVMVLTRAEGLGAEEVEQRVSYPLEQRMGGLPRLQLVRSLSRAGLSQVVVVFTDGTDPWFARQVVFERLQEARDALPDGLEPELAPLSTGLGEIFQYTVEGDSLTLTERRAIQDWLVAPRLRSVAGVTEVNSFGGLVRQVEVRAHPGRLAEYGLAPRDLVEALARDNTNVGAGFIVHGWEQTYLLGRGQFTAPADIGRVVLRARDGAAVTVGDVAEVVEGAMTRQGAVTRDARGETVAGMVIMLRGENSRTVVQRVKAAVAAIGAALPAGARLDVFYDRTGLIEACVRTVTDALLQGGLFVILVLCLFLAELRTALIVVLSLPLTFLVAFLIMGAAGFSANLMSLGGLAFSVGMVVDASIVIVENVRRHLARAAPERSRREVAVAALTEVARPVAFSVLIMALVLVPLLTLQGVEGKMFRPLALTLLFALLASLAVALTVVPVLAETFLARRPEREFGVVRRFHDGYLALLRGALARPRLTLALALATLLPAVALVPRLGTEFIPTLDEGALAINVVRLPNASLAGSVAVAGELERRLLRFPEVATVVAKSGRAEISEDPMGPEQTDLFVMLKPRRQWGTGRDREELVAAMNAELSRVPGLRYSFSQPIALRVNELISGVKSDLAVKVFGPDLGRLKEIADRTAAILMDVPGAGDIKVEQVAGMTELVVEPDRHALARYGLNAADLGELLAMGVAGRQVGTLVEGERRHPIVVRYPEADRGDVAALAGLLLVGPGGERVPLGQVARFVPREGPAQVSRENGARRVVVEANVRGRDLGGFVAEVRVRLREVEAALPPGYWLAYGGQFENQQRAMRQLALVVPLALVLIAGLLYGALGSARGALLVILNLPFALVGGVAAAVALRMHLSVSAAVAFIVLLGIAVQNGVVLLAFLRQLREAGRTPAEAVMEGCDLRFKPLFMTALTSFIGHLPMLLATGSGADIQKPLAAIVMGGIVTSTLLTLIVLPVLWHALERRTVATGTRPV